jgi:hypothetical protein
MSDEGRQEDRATDRAWLPPRAPDAEAPREWHSVPEPGPASTPPPAASAHSAAPPSASAPARDWWHADRPVAAPYEAPVKVQAPGNGHAVAALVLGIAGLVLFFAAGFGLLFVLNLPCSVLAWVLGRTGTRRVDRGETTARRGMAQAGMVLGIVGTVVGTLAVVAWALGFALSDDLRDSFRREYERRQRG